MNDILDLDKFIKNLEFDPENENNFPVEVIQIHNWLNELKTFRAAFCRHVIIPVKNEVVDGGYMCIKCGQLMEEYIGPCLNPKKMPTPKF